MRTALTLMCCALVLAGCEQRPRVSADVSVGPGGKAEVDSATVNLGWLGVKVKP